MAATDRGFTTGKDGGDIRRRNVQTYQVANGAVVHNTETEDGKKLEKVSSVRRVADHALTIRY